MCTKNRVGVSEFGSEIYYLVFTMCLFLSGFRRHVYRLIMLLVLQVYRFFLSLSLSLAYWSPQWASSENVLALLCCCYLIWLCLFPSQITIELNNMPWMANANVNPSQSERFDQFSLSQLTEVLSLDRFFVDFLSCVESSRFSHIDNYTGWLAFLCHSHNDIHKRPRVLKIFADLIQWESFFFVNTGWLCWVCDTQTNEQVAMWRWFIYLLICRTFVYKGTNENISHA